MQTVSVPPHGRTIESMLLGRRLACNDFSSRMISAEFAPELSGLSFTLYVSNFGIAIV